MSSNHHMKILVVGGGIAGPAVCYWLQRFGFLPTLIEKYPAIRKGGQALDVRGVAVALVKEMGIYERICEMRTQIECGRHVDPSGLLLHEEHGETFGFRQDDEVEIVRGDLVEILMNIIPDIPCRFNQSIESMQQNDEEITVQFKDGNVEQYNIVIGADGIYSSTRRMVFDKSEYHLHHLGTYLSTFTIPNYLKLNHTIVECEANEKLVMINSDHDTANARVGFMFRSDHVLKDPRDIVEQQAFLNDTFCSFGWEANNILEFMPSSDDFYFDSCTQVKMKSWTKGRIALLGDAGYCASPLSGQGNNLALIGAYILAGELKAAEGNYRPAFHRYNELMRPFIEANQEFGAWVSESYLKDEVSKKDAEERYSMILKMLKTVSNGIDLPQYE